MIERKGTKGQTMMYKTLHREQRLNEPHLIIPTYWVSTNILL